MLQGKGTKGKFLVLASLAYFFLLSLLCLRFAFSFESCPQTFEVCAKLMQARDAKMSVDFLREIMTDARLCVIFPCCLLKIHLLSELSFFTIYFLDLMYYLFHFSQVTY